MQMNQKRFNSGLLDEDKGFKFESKKGEKLWLKVPQKKLKKTRVSWSIL